MTLSLTRLMILVFLLLSGCRIGTGDERIDRYNLVNRHIPVCYEADPRSPFTVGNGNFAFTVDVTGLQTLYGHYEEGIPLLTQSHWGWHTVPDTAGFDYRETYEYYDTHGRSVPYASDTRSGAAGYLRANPHRMNLARVGFVRTDPDANGISVCDLSGICQEMDIWNGVVKSSFLLENNQVNVETCVHPGVDQVAVSIESSELGSMSLGIGLDFPYGSVEWGKTASDWDQPERHLTILEYSGDRSATFIRQLDSTRYYVHLGWKGEARLTRRGDHRYLLEIGERERFEFTCRFSSLPAGKSVPVTETLEENRRFWNEFWSTGGAVDLSGSTHPGAYELERRIVLSQYLTAIQCSGSLPPAETGLTANSWFGKFHLEMHWWHAVHFALWGRPRMLERSLDWYATIMPSARLKAGLQGYDGVRWPKMTSPDGRDSPSGIGVFLIWQQPHPIYYAELLYRCTPEQEILERYRDMVFETARFMSSFACWDPERSRYVLGPPVIPAQEIYAPAETMNPAFELAYWKWGLETAQLWRERLGLERDEKWDHVIDHLSQLPAANGFYQNAETALNTFRDGFHRNDHPTLLGSFGMLPNADIDTEMMKRTLEQVMSSWNWERTWGWDYPLAAMTAARVGRPDLAVEALLMIVEKNTYLNNGHNYQSDRLPLYLPGNGGLLTAIAMMTAGWEGAPELHAPGFPKDGSWVVRYEGLEPLP